MSDELVCRLIYEEKRLYIQNGRVTGTPDLTLIGRQNGYTDGSYFGKISAGAFLPLCILCFAPQLPLFFGCSRLYNVVDQELDKFLWVYS